MDVGVFSLAVVNFGVFASVSGGVLQQRDIVLEWHDPVDNMTEADYYSLSAAMAAMNPSQGWDAAAQGYRPGRATRTHSCNHIRGVPHELRSSAYMKPSGLSTFYQKYTEAYGIPVLGSNRVSDDAMKRACYVTRFLFADHSRVRQSYYARSGRVAVIASSEGVTSIPEHSWLGPGWNQRARGLGATDTAPVSTCGEEHMLCQSTDRYRDEDIQLHEYVHGVHLLGAKYAIPGWQRRLESLYRSARYSGKWANTYSMSTQDEYFAEGTQSFFNVNAYRSRPDGVHNHVNTQAKLRAYDPALYQLVLDVFPCNNQYLKRCRYTRAQELQQQLRMDCDLNGGGTTPSPSVTTTREPGGGTTTPTTTTTTEAPGGCTDGHHYCRMTGILADSWYISGCTDGHHYCRMTGILTDSWYISGCADGHYYCKSWANYGYCNTNPDYMHVNCRKSCNRCGGGGNCQDRNEYCASWARRGECNRNPAYMHPNCARSCNRC
ncbi:hypothetical protein BaRGS_00021873 [Batillaria attramentaria]|uniref:ShKT domain-containing protein n=1 Tax=Batillaria attramentaria TaxID=370345 RepID=A0ABD0KIM2_9CAEN